MIFLIDNKKKTLEELLTNDPLSLVQFKKLGEQFNFFAIRKGNLYYNTSSQKSPIYKYSGYKCKVDKNGDCIIQYKND